MFDFKSAVGKVFGTRSDRELKKLAPLVTRVGELEKAMQARTDEELKALTPDFKQRVENGEPLDKILPEAFALVREVSVRTLVFPSDAAAPPVGMCAPRVLRTLPSTHPISC